MYVETLRRHEVRTYVGTHVHRTSETLAAIEWMKELTVQPPSTSAACTYVRSSHLTGASSGSPSDLANGRLNWCALPAPQSRASIDASFQSFVGPGRRRFLGLRVHSLLEWSGSCCLHHLQGARGSGEGGGASAGPGGGGSIARTRAWPTTRWSP